MVHTSVYPADMVYGVTEVDRCPAHYRPIGMCIGCWQETIVQLLTIVIGIALGLKLLVI